MTDLEKALAKIEEGIAELRIIDEWGADDLQNAVDSLRKEHADVLNDELDSAREEAA